MKHLFLIPVIALAAFSPKDEVVLRSTPPDADIIVWPGKLELVEGAKIIAQRLQNGEDIDPTWLKSVVQCTVPAGTKAQFVSEDGIYAKVIVQDTPSKDGPSSCEGVVLTEEVKALDE